MTDHKAMPLTAEELAAIETAGSGWCDEHTFSRVFAIIRDRDRQIAELNQHYRVACLQIANRAERIRELEQELSIYKSTPRIDIGGTV